MLLSFVIPVLNEEKSLKQLYHEITSSINDWQYEIIFIDDGSKDSSLAVMTGLSEKDNCVKVIVFRKNFGKAAALQIGFETAKGDIIITMDADLQDNPIEIPRFINKLEEGFDLVVGWKKKRKDPFTKTMPSKCFNSVVSGSFKLPLHDHNCGFKAFRKELVKELDIYGEMHRYIPALAQAKGFRITEIPVEHRKRTFGKSKYGIERYLRGFLDLLTVKLVTSYIRSPLYLFGGIGILFSFGGFFIGLYLTVLKYWFQASLSNRPLLFLAILFIMIGFQFLSIGLLGELIIHQQRRTNKKQLISIKKTFNVDNL
jgi:glycosyltransferase involved in cell wall biosynthesis